MCAVVVLCATGCDDVPPVRHVAVGWQGGVGGGAVLRSSVHGMTWKEDDVFTTGGGTLLGGAFNDVTASDSGRFVAVGRGTLYYMAAIQYSDDMGESWLAGNNDLGGAFETQLHGVAFVVHPLMGDTFVAVGDHGTMLRSLNGETWVASSSANISADWRDVAYGLDRFVAVGVAQSNDTANGSMAESFNGGQTWTAVDPGVRADLYGIAFGNGTFVAVGENGTIIYSTNAVDWNAAPSLTENDLYDAAFGYDQEDEGIWVAVGKWGVTRFSLTDGRTWVNRNGASPTQQHLYGTTYAMGKFVAVGESITLWTLDGRDWSIGTVIPQSYQHLRAVARP
jgi:hypothetical protein